MYPATGRQMAASGAFFVVGVSLVGIGTYLSFVNIAPQQARMKARSEALKNYIRKRLGD